MEVLERQDRQAQWRDEDQFESGFSRALLRTQLGELNSTAAKKMKVPACSWEKSVKSKPQRALRISQPRTCTIFEDTNQSLSLRKPTKKRLLPGRVLSTMDQCLLCTTKTKVEELR
ncbi:hypothetical protein U0070_020216 [Myodes glareolus]|uniref:Uncharacterized protein n=1 Tax=Myodes glareolus TaxID=447135 RepID=A0AAW0HW58_MYOGA